MAKCGSEFLLPHYQVNFWPVFDCWGPKPIRIRIRISISMPMQIRIRVRKSINFFLRFLKSTGRSGFSSGFLVVFYIFHQIFTFLNVALSKIKFKKKIKRKNICGKMYHFTVHALGTPAQKCHGKKSFEFKYLRSERNRHFWLDIWQNLKTFGKIIFVTSISGPFLWSIIPFCKNIEIWRLLKTLLWFQACQSILEKVIEGSQPQLGSQDVFFCFVDQYYRWNWYGGWQLLNRSPNIQ